MTHPTDPGAIRRSVHTTPAGIYPLPGYPTVYHAPDGEQITIRPLVPTDKESLLAFFQKIPPDDRLYLTEDVTSSEVIARWAKTLDYRRALPLLALAGGKIVGDGTLHRDPAPERRHIGAVRIVIDPAYRNKGLGRFLLKRLVDVAKDEDNELEKIVFEVVADTEQAAQHAARALGFAPGGTFSALVSYVGGTPHDLIVMELQVGDARTEVVEDPAKYMF